MDDSELRSQFDEVHHDIERLRDMLTAAHLRDAEARADAKIVAGKLENAATALANAAQASQARDLKRGPAKWERNVIIALLGIIAALIGAKAAGVIP